MRVELTVDDDGAISRFTVERIVVLLDEEGREIDEDRPGARRVQFGHPITGTYLKSLKFGEIADRARINLSWFADAAPSSQRHELAWARDIERGPQGRAKRVDERFLATVADVYARAVASGSRRPAADVGDELFVADQTARNYVRAARRAGLLTETTDGQAGGRLTPKATAILEADGAES